MIVMAGLVPAIHTPVRMQERMDARVSAFGRPGHDEKSWLVALRAFCRAISADAIALLIWGASAAPKA
jgi:hypothetical protein